MRSLSIRNPDLTGLESSSISTAYVPATSTTSLVILNTFAFASNDVVVVGNPGEEKTENKKVDAIASDTQLTLSSALKFSHQKETPIYKTPWDQIEISYNISGGSWTLLTTTGIQWDKSYTSYVHTSGDSTYNYRWRFVNSVISTYSEYSPTYSGAGFNSNQVGYLIREARKITRTENDQKVVTDRELVRQLNTAQDIIKGVRSDWWFLKTEDDSILARSGILNYNLDTLGGGTAGNPASGFKLGFVGKIKYEYNSGGTHTVYSMKYKSEDIFDQLIVDQDRQTDDFVNVYTIRPGDSSSVNGYMDVYPTPESDNVGTFHVTFYKDFPVLDDDADTTPIPIPGILVDFLVAYIEQIRGNDSKASYYRELFYGPPPKAKGARSLTGIPLLEQMNDKKYPVDQPRSLVKFQGQKAISRLYGNRVSTSGMQRDYERERYW